MTEPDGMYDEEIRRALSAVADLVVPDGDGLEKIRNRTRHRSPAMAWLIAYSTYLPRALVTVIRVPGSALVVIARGEFTLAGRRRDAPSQEPRSPQVWLRPTIAVAGALVFVAAVLLAVPRLRQTITTSALTNPSSSANATGGNGGPGGIGETAGATQDKVGPAPGTSGFGITMPPPVGAVHNGKCPDSSGSGSPSPTGSPTPETSGAGNGSSGEPVTHCPSSSPSPGSSSPGASTSPSSPGSSPSPPPTGSTSPIPPTGGGTPTPTTSAISDSPAPSAGDTGDTTGS